MNKLVSIVGVAVMSSLAFAGETEASLPVNSSPYGNPEDIRHLNMVYLDASSSMKAPGRKNAVNLLSDITPALVLTNTPTELYLFASQVWNVEFPMTQEVMGRYNRSEIYTGGTYLWGKIHEDVMEKSEQFNSISLYILTDGEDNRSQGDFYGKTGVTGMYNQLEDVIPNLMVSGIVYGTGVSTEAREAFKAVVERSNGRYWEIGQDPPPPPASAAYHGGPIIPRGQYEAHARAVAQYEAVSTGMVSGEIADFIEYSTPTGPLMPRPPSPGT